jgi:DNA-binding FadR family transcriptional regulator
MSLDPLPPLSTRVDACVDRLETAILDGTFAPGSRLPPERSLAEHLAVTRITLRSALARLSARGLVSAHQGRGTMVRDFMASGGPDLIGQLLSRTGKGHAFGAIVRDLLAVRRALAGVVLERLAEIQPDPGHTMAAVAAFVAAVDDGADAEALAAADVAILRAMLTATGSPVLQLCLNPILSVLGNNPALRSALYRTPADNAAGWVAAATWIQAPRADTVPALLALLAERDAETCAWLSKRRR